MTRKTILLIFRGFFLLKIPKIKEMLTFYYSIVPINQFGNEDKSIFDFNLIE